LLGLLRSQVGQVLTAIPLVITGGESLARLTDILDEEASEPYSGTRPIDFQGGIELRHVAFSYGDRPTLRDVSMEIAPGERVALVGPNGAGKSTILSLIGG